MNVLWTFIVLVAGSGLLAPLATAGPQPLILDDTASPKAESVTAGGAIVPGRMSAEDRGVYDNSLRKYNYEAKNLEGQLTQGFSGFLNGLGGYAEGMKSFTGLANDVNLAGKSDQQRFLMRLFTPGYAEPDPKVLFRDRTANPTMTFARKRYVEKRQEFSRFKSGVACDLNFSKLFGGGGAETAQVQPAPVHYGLVLREIKISDEERRLNASQAPIDGDDLRNANKPEVLWDVGPVMSASGSAFAVNLNEAEGARGGLLENTDWSYYKPDFGLRFVPREGLESNTGTLPSGKPVKLITEQKRGFYRMEMDSLDYALIHHFFTVPLYQKLNVAYVFNKQFVEEKISLLNVLAREGRPTLHLHYLPLTARVKSELKTAVGPYALTFGSDTSRHLVDKDEATKYEMGMSRSF